MALASLGFLAFLSAAALVYYLIPRRMQWGWLLISSLAFYALTSYGLLLVPVCEAVICFLFGKRLEQKKTRGGMLAAVLLLLLILIAFKYAGWFGPGFQGALQSLTLGFSETWMVPLGLSYFTIMSIAYLTDVYRGVEQAERNFGKLLLFLIFFPITSQGPVLRYGDVARQFTEGAAFRYEALTFGAQRILWGFFKKLVLSERLAVLSMTLSEGWGNGGYTGIWVIASILAFSFRLYMDFSGCMDIVIGTGEILGIRLPENFNHSYLSRTIPEFWRRWHITLGTWLRDYVMYSVTMSKPAKLFTRKAKKVIGRKAAATVVTCVGILLVWLVYALWHDVSVAFLISGAFYAVIIILSTVLDPVIRKFRKRCSGLVESVPYKVFMTLRTMLLSMMGAYFIFMPTLSDGLRYLLSLFRAPSGAVFLPSSESASLLQGTILGLDLPDFAVFVLGMGLWILVSRLHAGKDPRERMKAWKLPVRWIVLLALVLSVVLFGKYGGLDTGSFVYQGF